MIRCQGRSPTRSDSPGRIQDARPSQALGQEHCQEGRPPFLGSRPVHSGIDGSHVTCGSGLGWAVHGKPDVPVWGQVPSPKLQSPATPCRAAGAGGQGRGPQRASAHSEGGNECQGISVTTPDKKEALNFAGSGVARGQGHSIANIDRGVAAQTQPAVGQEGRTGAALAFPVKEHHLGWVCGGLGGKGG